MGGFHSGVNTGLGLCTATDYIPGIQKTKSTTECECLLNSITTSDYFLPLKLLKNEHFSRGMRSEFTSMLFFKNSRFLRMWIVFLNIGRILFIGNNVFTLFFCGVLTICNVRYFLYSMHKTGPISFIQELYKLSRLLIPVTKIMALKIGFVSCWKQRSVVR